MKTNRGRYAAELWEMLAYYRDAAQRRRGEAGSAGTGASATDYTRIESRERRVLSRLRCILGKRAAR